MMLRAVGVDRQGHWPEERKRGSVTLSYDGRHRRRLRLGTETGEALLLDLPQAMVLREGDGLVLEGGPVGSGKTALVEMLCKHLRDRHDIFVITNDIYTREDQVILTRAGALEPERILGVGTGGCPHTAIREDASFNLAVFDDMAGRFPQAELCLIELGGDNFAATFSPELADLTIYVIGITVGEKIPRKGGPGITRSDLLIINKTDLAPLVGADLGVMDRDARKMRGERPFLFSNLKTGEGVVEIARFIKTAGGLTNR